MSALACHHCRAPVVVPDAEAVDLQQRGIETLWDGVLR